MYQNNEPNFKETFFIVGVISFVCLLGYITPLNIYNYLIPIFSIFLFRFYLVNEFKEDFSDEYSNQNLINFYITLLLGIFLLYPIFLFTVKSMMMIIDFNIIIAVILGLIVFALFCFSFMIITQCLLFSIALLNDISFSLIFIYLIIQILVEFKDKEKLKNNMSFFFCYLFIFIITSLLLSLSPLSPIINYGSTIVHEKTETFNLLANVKAEFKHNEEYVRERILITSLLAVKDVIFFYNATIFFFQESRLKSNIKSMYTMIISNILIIIGLSIYDFEKLKEYIITSFILILFLYSLTLIREVRESYKISLAKLENISIFTILILFTIPLSLLFNHFYRTNLTDIIILVFGIAYQYNVNNETIPNFNKRDRKVKTGICLTLLVCSVFFLLYLTTSLALFGLALSFLLLMMKDINNKLIKNDETYKKWLNSLSNPEKLHLKKYKIENEYDTEELIRKLIIIRNDYKIDKEENLKEIKNEKHKQHYISDKFNTKVEELLNHLENKYVIYDDKLNE